MLWIQTVMISPNMVYPKDIQRIWVLSQHASGCPLRLNTYENIILHRCLTKWQAHPMEILLCWICNPFLFSIYGAASTCKLDMVQYVFFQQIYYVEWFSTEILVDINFLSPHIQNIYCWQFSGVDKFATVFITSRKGLFTTSLDLLALLKLLRNSSAIFLNIYFVTVGAPGIIFFNLDLGVRILWAFLLLKSLFINRVQRE